MTNSFGQPVIEESSQLSVNNPPGSGMNIKPVHCVVVHEHKVGGELVLVGKGEGGQVRGLGADTEPGLARGRGGDMKVRGKPLNIGLEKKTCVAESPWKVTRSLERMKSASTQS